MVDWYQRQPKKRPKTGLPHEDHDELPAAPGIVGAVFEIQIPRVVEVSLDQSWRPYVQSIAYRPYCTFQVGNASGVTGRGIIHDNSTSLAKP